MHSSWFPWDIVRNHPYLVLPEKKGIYGFWAYDSFMEKLLINRLRDYLSKVGSFRVFLGDEITLDWIESNLMNIGLFGNNESYVILQSENIGQNVKKYLLRSSFDFNNRYMVFFFSRESKFFDEYARDKDTMFIKIKAPRFWESGRLLDFLSEEKQIRISYEVKKYIIDSVPNNTGDFVYVLNVIKTYFNDSCGDLSLQKVKKLISPYKLDQFQLASLYAQKKQSLFFKKIIFAGYDFDMLRNLFSFMQSHLLRLADTSYVSKKVRLSKYDKEILAHAKLWRHEELQRDMRAFAELEIDAKKRDPNMKNKLRIAYLSASQS